MQTKEIPIGPEPEYERVVSGYETFVHSAELKCEWGATLPEVTIAYETWGELSPERDNAVLLHTGLSASSHAHSQPRNPHPGWWEDWLKDPRWALASPVRVLATMTASRAINFSPVSSFGIRTGVVAGASPV